MLFTLLFMFAVLGLGLALMLWHVRLMFSVELHDGTARARRSKPPAGFVRGCGWKRGLTPFPGLRREPGGRDIEAWPVERGVDDYGASTGARGARRVSSCRRVANASWWGSMAAARWVAVMAAAMSPACRWVWMMASAVR